MDIPTFPTAFSAVIGIALGIYAAYAKGIAEEIIMAMVDAQAAVPFITVALMLLAFMGNSLWLFIVIMGIAGWEGYARLSRGLVLSAENQGYVISLRSLGGSSGRIYLRHILPNIAGTMITQMTLSFPGTMLWRKHRSAFWAWASVPRSPALGKCSAPAATISSPRGGWP